MEESEKALEQMEIDNYIAYIKRNHEREVIAGKMVCHDGDCGIYRLNVPVCTCGLLHKLLPFAGQHYEEAIKLYPKYEEDLKKQEIWEMLTQGHFEKEELEKIFKPLTDNVVSEKEFELMLMRIFT